MGILRMLLRRPYHLVFRQRPSYYLGWCVWQLLGTASRRDKRAARYFESFSAKSLVDRWLVKYIATNSSKEGMRAFLWRGEAGASWHRRQLRRYTDDRGPFMRVQTAVIEKVLQFVSTRRYSHVIEVGCSNGHTIDEIARRSLVPVKLVGIDINEQVIAGATSRWGGSSVEYRCCTLEEYVHSASPRAVVVFAIGTFAYMTETEMQNVLRCLTEEVALGALVLHERFAELPDETESAVAPDLLASFHNYPSLLERFGFQNIDFQLFTDKSPTDLHIRLFATWE